MSIYTDGDCYSSVPFPEYLGIMTQAEYSDSLSIQKEYLGGVSAQVGKDTISFTFEIPQLMNQEEFLRWWALDLDYGRRTFSIGLRFYGAHRSMNVLILNDLSEERTCVKGISIPMVLEVHDD